MLAASTIHPGELAPADAAAWAVLCAANGASPLMGPDFARAVGRVREDARVTIWRRDGRAVGFLPHKRSGSRGARPLGAPLSDYHGPVAAPGLDLQSALSGAGLAAYRFTSLLDLNGGCAGAARSAREAYVIALEGTAAEYLEALRAASPKRFKNVRRLEHKIARERGEVTIIADDRSPQAFETLLAWKRAQLARSGAHDFLAAPWVDRLLRDLFAGGEGELKGLMINMYVDGELAAGHFGVRLGEAYHPWIASRDPELTPWSPGQIFLARAIGEMDGLGLVTYDLGPGHDHYKAPFARSRRTVLEGVLTTRSPSGRMAEAVERAWGLADRCSGLSGRVRRRLEMISAVEQTLGGRIRGLANAVAAGGRHSEAEF